MKIKMIIPFVMASWLCDSSFAIAQGNEAALNYSLMVYNPAKNLAGSRNLNGGGGSIVHNFGEYFAVKGEFEGYGSTTLTYHVPATSGSIQLTNAFSTQANMFTYMFGPQVSTITSKGRIFGEALFGAAYTNAYVNLFKDAGVTGLSASNNGFAMAFGGGFDIPINQHLGLRPVQFDYLMTRYEWKPIGINNQSNFRYQAGIVLCWGSM